MKKILSWVLVIVGFVACACPVVIWFANPHFTQMQIFRRFFWLSLVGFVVIVAGYYVIQRREEMKKKGD
jgi:general stress protein CsbA